MLDLTIPILGKSLILESSLLKNFPKWSEPFLPSSTGIIRGPAECSDIRADPRLHSGAWRRHRLACSPAAIGRTCSRARGESHLWRPSVSESIAQGWDSWDLDAAMAWHLEHQKADGPLSWHDFTAILTSQESSRAVDWLEKNVSSGLVSDETLSIYASTLRDDKNTESLERVIGLPK